MAVTQNSYTGNNSTTTYSFTFPYLKQTEIKASLDGVATTNFSIPTATTIQFHNGATPPVATAPGTGVKIRIFRETDTDSLAATFYAGSAIKSQDLNDNFTQNLYATQEAGTRYVDKFGGSIMTGDLQLGEDVVVKFEGATDNDYETTLTVVDPTADRTITLPNVTGTVVTTGDDGTVTSAMITNATIVNADINASAAIAQSKLNIANATTSAAGYQSAADKTKLDGIDTGAKDDQTAAEIRVLVESASDSNVFTDADHSKLNAIEVSATADQTAAEIRTLVESAEDSNVFTDADHTKLNAIEASATADQTASEIKTLIASSPLDASHLATDSVTTDEIADAQLTTLAGMQSGTASTLASSNALTATIDEINIICDGKTVQTVITDSDTNYPTSGAVVDYVAAQLAPIGGLEVIADSQAFPQDQPQSGVVISIADAGGIVVNGSGTSVSGRTTGSLTVTINNIASNFNSSTVDTGVAMMVSSTGSDQIYNYHKATLKEADLLSLSNDINDFAARYRVASSAPSSNNDEGDLWYNTSGNKLQVYNSSTSSWADVTTVGDFNINTISSSGNTGGGSATFNGTAYRFVLSNPPTSAQQLIVSINGVIQKPNSGTSQPSEGFAISGADIIFSAAPATGSDYFIITQGSAVSVGTPSDNTVSTAKIQNLAVTGDKVATNLDLADNKKIRFGTENDLEIYHDGSHSYIKDTGTGELRLSTSQFTVQNAAGDETLLYAVDGGAVGLKHNDSLKFETTSTGATLTGTLLPSADNTGDIGSDAAAYNTIWASTRFRGNDNVKLILGDAQDLEIYHDGVSNNNSYIKHTPTDGNLLIESGANIAFNVKADEKALDLNSNGSVALYYDGGTYSTAKFETTSTGAKVTGRLDTTGATHVSGQNTVHAANTLAIGHEGSSKSQLRAYGADASTKGTIEFKFTTSDGSANDPNITFAAGGATFGGDVSGIGTCTATSFSGSGANLTNLPPSGLVVADSWRAGQFAFDNNVAYIDGATWSKTSSASSSVMTVTTGDAASGDTGIFTFPSTGMYRIDYQGVAKCNDASAGKMRLLIGQTTDNGSTWSYLFQGEYVDFHDDDHYINITAMEFFNVTNTSNDKVRFGLLSNDDGQMNETRVIFMKLN